MNYLNVHIFFKIILMLILIFFYSCSVNQAYKTEANNKNYLKESNFAIIDTNEIKSVARDYVVRGSSLQQTGNHYAAIVEFYDALELDSSNSIYFALAKSYFEIGKYEKSKKLLVKIINEDSKFFVAYELLAKIYILNEAFDKAIQIYEDLVNISQNNNYYYTLASLYEYSNPQKAIEVYEFLLEKKNVQTVLPKLLSLYITTENHEKYQNILKKLVINYPGNGEYNYRLSEILIANKEYDSLFNILTNFDRNAGLDDKTEFYRYLAGYILDNEIKNKDLIEKFYLLINNKYPFDEYLLMYSGIFAYILENQSDYENYFTRALKISTQPSRATISIVAFLLSQNNTNLALTYLHQDTSESWERYNFIALAYQIQKDTIHAIQYYLKATELDSSKVDSWINLGVLYSFINDIENSDSAYIKALALDPNEPLLNNNYAYSLSERGKNLPQALAMSKIAIKFDSTNSSYLDTYGWILYKMGNYEEALKYITKAVEYSEDSAEVYEHLGEILIMLNRKEEAVEAWKNAIELDNTKFYLKEKILNYQDK